MRFIDHALKPEPCLESGCSSDSPFINIIRALSPPKVLLGLKGALSGGGVSGSSLRFLKAGISLFSKDEKLLLELELIEST